METARSLLHCLKILWTLVHKRLKVRPAFLPTLCKFCILFHYHAPQTEISKQNSTKVCQTMDSKWRWQPAVEKSGSSLPKNWGPKKLIHLFGFSTTSRLNGECLLNETRRRQLSKGIGKYKGTLHCLKISRTLVHIQPKIGPEFLSGLSILFRLQSIAHALSGTNVAPYGEVNETSLGLYVAQIWSPKRF